MEDKSTQTYSEDESYISVGEEDGPKEVLNKGAVIAVEESFKPSFSGGATQKAPTQGKTRSGSPPSILDLTKKGILREKKAPVKTKAALKLLPISPMVPFNWNPPIILHDIPRSIAQEDLAAFIHGPTFQIPLESFKKGFIPAYMTGSLSEPVVSWVVEVSPLVRDELLKLGRTARRVPRLPFNSFKMGMCPICLRYGHNLPSCFGPLACSNCAEYGHSLESCNAPLNPACINCKRAALPYDHDVRSRNCYSYLKRCWSLYMQRQ